MPKLVRCAWENSDVQDFHRLHFEIITSAAASIPKEVRAYLERGSRPASQAHLERGFRLDLVRAPQSENLARKAHVDSRAKIIYIDAYL